MRVLAFYRGPGEAWPGRLSPALMALTPLKALRLGLKGIKGRSDGGGAVMSQRYPDARRGRRRARWRGRGHGGAVGKKKLTCGVHMSARGEREDAADGRRDSKKKAYYPEYAIGTSGPSGQWAGKARRLGPAVRPRPGRAGRLGREGLPGRKVGRAEIKKKNF